MTLNYPKVVDTNKITIDEKQINGNRFRYSLTIPLKNKGSQTLLVVMMNPSKATKEQSDSTINRVIRYVTKNRLGYSQISVVNLYPIYETFSRCLQNYEDEEKENLDTIKILLQKSDDILLGWGRPSKKSEIQLHTLRYHHKSLAVIKLCQNLNKNIFIIGSLVNEELYPRHLGRIGYSAKMNELDLEYIKNKLEKTIDKNKK